MTRQLETTQCCSPSEQQVEVFLRGTHQPVPIILDTDFSPDVDDVGALAILHALADQVEANILGVLISSGDPYAARAVATINDYYGRPDIPIGIPWNPTVTTDSPYTKALALDFPNHLEDKIMPVLPNAVSVYRQLLAVQPDHSVTIVCIGFLNNMRDLLDSEPDDISDLSGYELAKTKVARVVLMGGAYPDSGSHPTGAEYNFVMDPESACAVIKEWPTPIIFTGFELSVDIMTGATLQDQTPPENPVRVAYKLYTGGDARNSWDLVTVHYAVRGSAGGYQLCTDGINEVTMDGKNFWNKSVTTKHHAYLINSVPKEEIENMIEILLVQPPLRASK